MLRVYGLNPGEPTVKRNKKGQFVKSGAPAKRPKSAGKNAPKRKKNGQFVKSGAPSGRKSAGKNAPKAPARRPKSGKSAKRNPPGVFKRIGSGLKAGPLGKLGVGLLVGTAAHVIPVYLGTWGQGFKGVLTAGGITAAAGLALLFVAPAYAGAAVIAGSLVVVCRGIGTALPRLRAWWAGNAAQVAGFRPIGQPTQVAGLLPAPSRVPAAAHVGSLDEQFVSSNTDF